MDLQALFKRKTTGPAAAVAEDPVQEARTRARRRLVGAAVLLLAGVVAFPLLFETQPRPVALNTPIQVAGRDGPAASAPGAVTAARAVARAPAASEAAVAPSEPPPPDPQASAPVAAVPVPVPAPVAAAPASAPPAPSVPAGARVETIRPASSAAPAAVAAAATAAAASEAASSPRARRFVVQGGACAAASAAREVRLKVEKLGLKTYTQVVDVDGSKRTRVRVGPYERREEAQKTAERLKAAGLASSTVLAL
jgi:DedD protein